MSIDPGPTRVLTVDDHAILRQGIAALVNGESDMKLGCGSL
jgi:DNA-binding NarL/FixJ family response regulator